MTVTSSIRGGGSHSPSGLTRVHSSIHKCLTMYYARVMSALYNRFRPGPPRYKHYAALQEEFYANVRRHRISSANGFAMNLGRLPSDFRIVRFVRDPRDLVVSGYLYHRRGAEPWFRTPSPTEESWAPIAGHVPEGMPPGISFAEYLQALDVERGLLAEMEFRRHHFEALRHWPSDPRIRVFEYERIVGHEREVFGEIFSFYELPRYERRIGMWLAERYAAGHRSSDSHVRDPRPGQWREYFTASVSKAFEREHGDLLDRLGYRA